jgi:hypothetical protein
VIGLFVWAPLGMRSLLQKLGSLLCCEARTLAELENLRIELGQELASDLEQNFDDIERLDINRLTRQEVWEYVKENSEFELDDMCRDFVFLLERLKQKKDFIAYLVDPVFLELVTHLGHIFPNFLKRLAKVSDFVTLLTLAFSNPEYSTLAWRT